ncbi:GNAT family N-acetyltransferase [Thalassospira xiamenensis]|uniref:N-acetyltransferase domain-containing protein n=1 Tax=Thalassospira xiamenensis TaxID=220697 RepID=A0ABR5Y6Q9_9PROT|nr:GNAT family N-acetyltransferase [Thalassospira xiamenensis]KZD06155.1 hypothetical protein AUP40_11150 [Thalassospira xiamenensis]KZD07557.1 hypothetical protein AUP45_03990 [Thalassospira xiamenensis]
MTAEKNLRPAIPIDIEPLARVWHNGWHEAHAAYLPTELTRLRTLESFVARFSSMLEKTMVHEINGHPTGFCTIQGAELMHLFVCRTDRGTGTAGALLMNGERRLVEAGITTAWLACVIGNTRAARFYEHFGWRQVGTMIYNAPTEAGNFPVEEWRLEKHLDRSN